MRYFTHYALFSKIIFYLLLKLVSYKPLDNQNHVQGATHMCKVLLCFWVALLVIFEDGKPYTSYRFVALFSIKHEKFRAIEGTLDEVQPILSKPTPKLRGSAFYDPNKPSFGQSPALSRDYYTHTAKCVWL